MSLNFFVTYVLDCSRPAAWPSALRAKHCIAAAAKTRFARLRCNGFKTQGIKGCSKMLGSKARDVMRNEAYFPYAAITNDELNAADERFSTARRITSGRRPAKCAPQLRAPAPRARPSRAHQADVRGPRHARETGRAGLLPQ